MLLVLDRGRIAGLQFLPPETPKAPAPAADAPYTERDVTIGDGEWKLPGTLSMPKGAGPFPAVVLVHGSGPHDRDETIGPNRPFRDLAEGLASRGIAVLRYEKRSKVHGPKLATLSTLTVAEETVEDAVLAAELARGIEGIDPERVFVLGHSLGGMLAPRIAQRAPKLAGIVILAGNVRPLQALIAEQLDYLASLEPGEASEQITAMRKEAERVESVTAETTGIVFGAPASYWLDLADYDPAATARTLPQRILVLQGERDYQVTMSDYALWREALASRADAELHSYPDLNHLFMAGEGKSSTRRVRGRRATSRPRRSTTSRRSSSATRWPGPTDGERRLQGTVGSDAARDPAPAAPGRHECRRDREPLRHVEAEHLAPPRVAEARAARARHPQGPEHRVLPQHDRVPGSAGMDAVRRRQGVEEAMNANEKMVEREYRVDGAMLRADWPLLVLMAADLVYGVVSWSAMPERVPVHWGLSGQPDGFGPAWVNAIGMSLLAFALYALLLFLPLVDPRRRNYALFGDTVRFVRWLVVLFAIGMHVMLVRVSLGSELQVDFIVRLGIALLFLALGNVMGRLRQNYFIGIRVPWTLSNEEVWNRTHRMAGRMWVVGALGMIVSAFLPAPVGMAAFVAIVLVLVVVPIVYSWRIHRQVGGAQTG